MIFNVKEDFSYELEEAGDIRADNFETKLEYWAAHAKLVNLAYDLIIIEDYRLYNHAGAKASMQSYSQMETPRLIGILEYLAWMNNRQVVFQMANQMKAYDEEVLIKRNLLRKQGKRYYYNGSNIILNGHKRSAFKHFLKWLGKAKGE